MTICATNGTTVRPEGGNRPKQARWSCTKSGAQAAPGPNVVIEVRVTSNRDMEPDTPEPNSLMTGLAEKHEDHWPVRSAHSPALSQFCYPLAGSRQSLWDACWTRSSAQNAPAPPEHHFLFLKDKCTTSLGTRRSATAKLYNWGSADQMLISCHWPGFPLESWSSSVLTSNSFSQAFPTVASAQLVHDDWGSVSVAPVSRPREDSLQPSHHWKHCIPGRYYSSVCSSVPLHVCSLKFIKQITNGATTFSQTDHTLSLELYA